MPQNEIVLATTNFAPTQIDSLRWGAEDFTDFTKSTGYDGLEYHPLRSRLALQAYLGSAGIGDVILSFHQSFRGESAADMWQYAKHNRPEFIRCLPASMLLPEASASLEALSNIQKMLATERSLIAYPEKTSTPLDTVRTSVFSEVLMQPKATDADFWNDVAVLAKDSDQEEVDSRLINYLRRKNMTGFCIDLAHWEQPIDQQKLPHWERVFPALIASDLVSEIHIGPYRNDLPGLNDDGTQLHDLVNDRAEHTLIGKQLSEIKGVYEDHEFPQVVIEITPKQALSIVKKSNLNAKPVPANNLRSIHRELTYVVRDLVS